MGLAAGRRGEAAAGTAAGRARSRMNVGRKQKEEGRRRTECRRKEGGSARATLRKEAAASYTFMV